MYSGDGSIFAPQPKFGCDYFLSICMIDKTHINLGCPMYASKMIQYFMFFFDCVIAVLENTKFDFSNMKGYNPLCNAITSHQSTIFLEMLLCLRIAHDGRQYFCNENKDCQVYLSVSSSSDPFPFKRYLNAAAKDDDGWATPFQV